MNKYNKYNGHDNMIDMEHMTNNIKRTVENANNMEFSKWPSKEDYTICCIVRDKINNFRTGAYNRHNHWSCSAFIDILYSIISFIQRHVYFDPNQLLNTLRCLEHYVTCQH